MKKTTLANRQANQKNCVILVKKMPLMFLS